MNSIDDISKRLAMAGANIVAECNGDFAVIQGTFFNVHALFEQSARAFLEAQQGNKSHAAEALLMASSAGVLIGTNLFYSFAFKKVLIIVQMTKSILVIIKTNNSSTRRLELAKLSFNVIDLAAEVYAKPVLIVARITSKVALQAFKAAHHYNRGRHIEAFEAVVIGVLVGHKGANKINELFPHKPAEQEGSVKPINRFIT